MKNAIMTLLFSMLVLTTSCISPTPEAKLQSAQESMLASTKLLRVAKSSGELTGARLKKAKVHVKRMTACIKAWRHSILTDKANDLPVSHRADLSLLIEETLIKLKQYHPRKPKKPKKKKEPKTKEKTKDE